MSTGRRHIAGFSLFETLVAIAIAGVFLAAIAIFTMNLGDTRARLARLSSRIECADAVFAALDRAIATAVVADARGRPGVTGDGSSIRLVRSAVGLGDDGGTLLGEAGASGIAFDPARGRVSVVRGIARDELGAEVRDLRIRYLAPDGWTESFDSIDAGGFPVAIEVSIWFANPQPDDADARAAEAEAASPDAAQRPALADPDRRRLFRIPGAPRIDTLALRRIREEGGE